MRRILGIVLACATSILIGPVLASPAAATPDVGVTARTPVIFVHGFTGSASNWTTAMSVFRAGGYVSNELFAYEYNWRQSNQTSAAGLRSFVNSVRSQTGAATVDIVNHSMGGLVSNWYLKELGGNQVVSHLASIAGANHGTTAAGACILLPSCAEMYPGSAFITRLSSGDETPGATRYGTWYSACDGVINPFTSTRLDGATNNNIACVTHTGFLSNTSVLTQIRNFMST